MNKQLHTAGSALVLLIAILAVSPAFGQCRRGGAREEEGGTYEVGP